MASTAGEVLTKITPSTVLFTASWVSGASFGCLQIGENEPENTPRCVRVIDLEAELPPLIEDAVARRIAEIMPELGETPKRIEELSAQESRENQLTEDFIAVAKDMLQELQGRNSSPYDYHTTLRRLLSALEDEPPPADE